MEGAKAGVAVLILGNRYGEFLDDLFLLSVGW
jgi:hypothetical protein